MIFWFSYSIIPFFSSLINSLVTVSRVAAIELAIMACVMGMLMIICFPRCVP